MGKNLIAFENVFKSFQIQSKLSDGLFHDAETFTASLIEADLVKTHLLYAVREEVEVLRDRIAELEKKLSRLEVENKMLRETAPPDLVAQVCSGMPLSVNTTVANSSTSNANYASPSHCCSDDRCPNVDKLNSNCSSADL
ncbi:TSC-22/dip/bun family protein [Trichinella nativa]|uniref:TSC-22/dip/bun family protein n=1 Tax=Trichinella nativa TaxID=6335 RepID=A0A1Y3EVX8_9BILA|nr:TSC-22/dip/bun family protein [Trichinella nativa]